MTGSTSSSITDKRLYLMVAWVTTLLVSQLPDIFFKELIGDLPALSFGAKVSLIVALLLVSLLWKNLRALWLFFAVLLAVYLLEWGVAQFYQSLSYITWFAGANSFVKEVGAVQIQRTTTAILLVLVMLVLVHRFDRFFFVKGKLDAQAAADSLDHE